MRDFGLSLVSVLLLVGTVGCDAPDHPVRLGARGLYGYHVSAGASSLVPDGEAGFVVTANGLGGYRVGWVGFDGAPSTFGGTITSDGPFDRPSILASGIDTQLTIATDNSAIGFSAVTGGSPEYVDFVPLQDPIYVDLRVDGAYGHIFFTGADTGHVYQSSYNPVAFTSP
jgi:hypothetical protein